MTDAAPTSAVDQLSDAELRTAVQEVIVELAPTKGQQVDDDSRLIEDLGYHSLALLELAFSLEDEFDLTPIDEQTAQTITTVRSVVDHVVTEVRARGGEAS